MIQKQRIQRSSLWRACFYVVLFPALAFIHISLRDYVADDAYIHVRIAQHLVEHGVPYFNVHEPIMASSSPLYTITLFLAFSIFGVNLLTLAILNSLATCLCALVFSRLARRVLASESFRVDLCVTVVVVSLLLESSISLMETPLALLVLGQGIHFYLGRRPVSFVFLCAAVFLRIELAVFFLSFVAHSLYTRRIGPGQIVLCALLGGVPWVLYDLYFFRTILPQTMEAKSAVFSLNIMQFAMITYRYLYGPHLSFNLRWLLIVHAVAAPWMFLATFLKGRPAFRDDKVLKSALLLFLPGATILAVYAAKRVLPFQWYLPLFLVPMFIGMFLVAYARKSALIRFAFAFFVFPVVLNLAINTCAALGYPGLYSDFVFGARTRQYMRVGYALQRKYPDATLLTTEIGALGFAFGGTIHDAAGLVSPAALKYHPMHVPQERSLGYIGAIPPEFVHEVKPDIIVSYDVFIEELMRSDLLDEYVHESIPALLPGDAAVADHRQLWFGQQLHVFVRKEIDLGPIQKESDRENLD